MLADSRKRAGLKYIHGVEGPKDECETCKGGKELANLTTLGHGSGATVDGEVPDDDKVSDSSNSVPAPLLRSAL